MRRIVSLFMLTLGIMLCSSCSASKTSEQMASGKEKPGSLETEFAVQMESEGLKERESAGNKQRKEETDSGRRNSSNSVQSQEAKETESSKERAVNRQTDIRNERREEQQAASKRVTEPIESVPASKEKFSVKKPVQKPDQDIPQTKTSEEFPEPVHMPENVPETTKAPEAEVIPEVTDTPEPEEAPEPAAPKSIYDYEFDVPAIRSELIALGQSMGLTHITDDDGVHCTPDTCSWASPVTASKSFQGDSLKGALRDYVTSMPSMITSYGGTQVTCFTIYVRDNGGGSYTFYFLY